MPVFLLIIAGTVIGVAAARRRSRGRASQAYVENHGMRMYGACNRIEFVDDLASEVYIDGFLSRYFSRNPQGPQTREDVESMYRAMFAGVFPSCANASPAIISTEGRLSWDDFIDMLTEQHLAE